MELLELIPFLESINEADDVCAYLRSANMNVLKARCNSLELNSSSWIWSTWLLILQIFKAFYIINFLTLLYTTKYCKLNCFK